MLSALALGGISAEGSPRSSHMAYFTLTHSPRGERRPPPTISVPARAKKQIYSVVGAVGNGIPTYEQGCARLMSRDSNLTQL